MSRSEEVIRELVSSDVVVIVNAYGTRCAEGVDQTCR
jgi:hypothetical protein